MRQLKLKKFFEKNSELTHFIHTGGLASGPKENLYYSNVLATSSLITELNRNNIKNVVFTSSGAVYGNSTINSLTEEAPLNPCDYYGFSKFIAEEELRMAERDGALNVTILRLSNVYGGNSKNGVIATLFKSIMENQQALIHGDGSQIRQFVHVDDVCDVLLSSLNHTSTGCFNIGSEIVMSVNDLVKLFGAHYTFNVTHKEEKNKLKNLVLNYDKARYQLAFTPKHQELDLSELFC